MYLVTPREGVFRASRSTFSIPRLRGDANRAARQGMLDLLRDAFNNNWNVTVDYDIFPPKKNGVIIRVALSK